MQRESGHWIAGSQDGELIVIGVTGRHEWRGSDYEIEAAKNDAARKVAMFYGLRGIIEVVDAAGSSVFDFIFDSRVKLEHIVDYRQFLDRLRFDRDRDVFVHDYGTMVRFRYAASVTQVNFVGSIRANGRPNWLDRRRLPELEGYIVEIGFSENQWYLEETVMLSAANVAARMIRNISTRVDFVGGDIAGEDAAVRTHFRSEGVLHGFRVLEFWIDPRNGHAYTLGIARFFE